MNCLRWRRFEVGKISRMMHLEEHLVRASDESERGQPCPRVSKCNGEGLRVRISRKNALFEPLNLSRDSGRPFQSRRGRDTAPYHAWNAKIASKFSSAKVGRAVPARRGLQPPPWILPLSHSAATAQVQGEGEERSTINTSRTNHGPFPSPRPSPVRRERGKHLAALVSEIGTVVFLWQ